MIGAPACAFHTMAPADLARTFALAALWGAAFLFFRIAAPGLGAILTAEIRVAVAAVVLGLYAAIRGERLALRGNWRAYLVIGAVSSATPFALFSFASMHLPAGLNAIMNGTSPLFGALVAAIVLGDRLTPRRIFALLMGLAGIAVLSGDPALDTGPMTLWAIGAGMAAALCYALAGVWTKLLAANISPLAMSVGTQTMAALLLAPLVPVFPAPGPITAATIAGAVALGVLCSGFGYLLYFRLIRDVGPVRTLLVTFLIPVFGVLWGALFLGERVTAQMVLGGLIVLLAIWLETRPRPS